MANIKASKKDAKRSALKAITNRSVKSSVKTKVQKFRRATIAGEDGESLEALATIAVSALDRAASKGIVHRNNAARRKSRLQKRLNTAAQSE